LFLSKRNVKERHIKYALDCYRSYRRIQTGLDLVQSYEECLNERAMPNPANTVKEKSRGVQRSLRVLSLILPCLCAAGRGIAADGSSESSAESGSQLGAITVTAAGVSNMTAASAGDVSGQQIASQPALRPASILENIPGLIVTQHSGEGKANQYFLRAFNLDHGTDLALEVDDMPVNLPSHAHGQGYSDFNFVIPELVDELHYKKGPYYADEGDFATAGTARVGLLNAVATSASVGFGEDGYRRGLLIGSTGLWGGILIGAGEIYHNDGPFDVPDDYNRLNGVVRYFRGDDRDYFTLTAMAYSGKWNSTDQLPERAIEEGVIDRFGSLNPTDGGVSSRSSLSFSRVKRSRTTSRIRCMAIRCCNTTTGWSTDSRRRELGSRLCGAHRLPM
jgi:hypothetical protein